MTSRSSRSTVLVRMLMVDLLDESGFKTFEVSDAKEAIALLEARSDIHVLLTDVNMPGLDRFALARHVREHWPNISILISSGRVRPTGDEVPEGAEFIAKPWSNEALVQRVANAAQRARGWIQAPASVMVDLSESCAAVSVNASIDLLHSPAAVPQVLHEAEKV